MRTTSSLFGWAALAALATSATPAFATTTYVYVGAPYAVFYTSCTPPGDPTAGPCVAYTAAMNAHGSFTLDTPLPPNFGPADISTRSDLVWSFSDGVNTYTGTDPQSLIEPAGFKVQTDAAGVPVFSGTVIAVDRWQTTAAPNNYFDILNIGYRPYSPPVGDYGNTGWKCFVVVGNNCNSSNYGPNIANAASAAAGTWSVIASAAPVTPVAAPSLTRSMMLLLIGALFATAAFLFRRT
jgi:hypothetical protein